MWDLPGPGIDLVSPAWAGRFFTTGHQGSPGHLFIFAGESASDTTERLHFSLSCIGGGMATHSSVLAWRIPGTGEPGGLPSVGSHRVGHD